MFENVGGKIKKIAKIICYLGIIASIIFGFIEIVTINKYGGFSFITLFSSLLTIGAGVLGSWIGSMFIYGFGLIVENNDCNAIDSYKNYPEIPANYAETHQSVPYIANSQSIITPQNNQSTMTPSNLQSTNNNQNIQ